jgi:hypothetical protein
VVKVHFANSFAKKRIGSTAETIKALRWLCLNIEWLAEKSEKVWRFGENGKFLYG